MGGGAGKSLMIIFFLQIYAIYVKKIWGFFLGGGVGWPLLAPFHPSLLINEKKIAGRPFLAFVVIMTDFSHAHTLDLSLP